MSDALQLPGLQLARLFCPWDFPGKNTGVGCHSLLQFSHELILGGGEGAECLFDIHPGFVCLFFHSSKEYIQSSFCVLGSGQDRGAEILGDQSQAGI